MRLIDRIMSCIKHRSMKLLSYAGRFLINSIMTSMSSYWMQCLSFPKEVFKKIKAIYHSFQWIGWEVIYRNSPVSWKQICTSNGKGGFNVVSLKEWNKANMAKLLWNLSGKKDNLWINWVNI